MYIVLVIKGAPVILCYHGHVLMENRSGLMVGAAVSHAYDFAGRANALRLHDTAPAGMAVSSYDVLLEESFGIAQTVVCEDHGYRVVDRFADEAALTKTIECIPTEALPGAVLIAQG